MRVFHVSVPLLLAGFLAGCAGSGDLLGSNANGGAGDISSSRAAALRACEGQADDRCLFINSPVKLSRRAYRFPDGPFPYYRTRDDLEFIDVKRRVWVAPAGTWTDGASIPAIFVPVMGDPRSPEFMNAATVHDAYCAERNRGGPYYHTAPWQDVHRMFYDGLRASGTPAVKAAIMYAAVYLGGPRWSEVRPAPKRQVALPSGPKERHASRRERDIDVEIMPTAGDPLAELRARQSDVPLPKLISKERLIAAFRRAKAHIETTAPAIDQLEAYLTGVELELRGEPSLAPLRRKRNFRAGHWRADPDTGGDGGDASNDSGQEDNDR